MKTLLDDFDYFEMGYAVATGERAPEYYPPIFAPLLQESWLDGFLWYLAGYTDGESVADALDRCVHNEYLRYELKASLPAAQS